MIVVYDCKKIDVSDQKGRNQRDFSFTESAMISLLSFPCLHMTVICSLFGNVCQALQVYITICNIFLFPCM